MDRTTRKQESTTREGGKLYMALELGWGKWKLAFTTEAGEKPRLRNLDARSLETLWQEIDHAKQRFCLDSTAPVVSCYEAGRDGFWLHRWLISKGVDNRVVDSSSIEVDRRARRAKSDGVDAQKLLDLLVRSEQKGQKRPWSVARVPSPQEEDARQLSRELEALKQERTRHSNRMRGLLASQGLDLEVGPHFREQLEQSRLWDGSAVEPGLRSRLERELVRLELLQEQISELDKQRRALLKSSEEASVAQVRKLKLIKALGDNSAWLFVYEFFSWRKFRNRREVAARAGLAPTPYQSGDSNHEQGISRAGNARIRSMAIEIAWVWVRCQPRSQLTLWFQERFGSGGKRSRRIGIVALARRLLVALWRYLETGTLPEGAMLKS
jgi:transposase